MPSTYTYTNTITQVDDSTINFELLSVDPPVVGMILDYSTFTNQRTAVVANMAASFPSDPLPNSYNLDSTVAGMGAVFGDSVYRYQGFFEDGSGTVSYSSDDYFLVTTAIDAGIAALPITTDAEIARKAYIVQLRQDIQDYFDAANYTDANDYITALTTILFSITSGILTLVATLPIPTRVTIAGNNVMPTTLSGGWYNLLTNTLSLVEYPYTWNFVTPSQTVNVDQLSDYPDGVYTNYSSNIVYYDAGLGQTAKLNEGTSYLLVTTTVDLQVALYGENHDTANDVQAAIYAQMLALQTDIDVAFAAEDYSETNTLIAELQALVVSSGGITYPIFAQLTTNSDMQVYFESLPEGVYTNATAVLTNTLTGVSSTFDGFPTEDTDLSTLLNSETLDFGTDFPDGVYQVAVNWYIDGLLFTATCYLVVTTDWQCCIDKAVGKKCGNLNTALMQSNLTNAVRIVAIYLDVNTANALIAEGNRLCGGCGCGCS